VHANGKDERAQPLRPPQEQIVHTFDECLLVWQTSHYRVGDDPEAGEFDDALVATVIARRTMSPRV
jgi:hypothetical protein